MSPAAARRTSSACTSSGRSLMRTSIAQEDINTIPLCVRRYLDRCSDPAPRLRAARGRRALPLRHLAHAACCAQRYRAHIVHVDRHTMGLRRSWRSTRSVCDQERDAPNVVDDRALGVLLAGDLRGGEPLPWLTWTSSDRSLHAAAVRRATWDPVGAARGRPAARLRPLVAAAQARRRGPPPAQRDRGRDRARARAAPAAAAGARVDQRRLRRARGRSRTLGGGPLPGPASPRPDRGGAALRGRRGWLWTSTGGSGLTQL